jgi:hypothetical protein
MWASGGLRGWIDERDDPRTIDPAVRAAAFRAAHGFNAAGALPSQGKLLLVASNVPWKEKVLARGRGLSAEYDYDTATTQSLVQLLADAVRDNEGPFGAIAVLMAEDRSKLISLSARMEEEGAVATVLDALGRAVRPNGRVDLIGCRLYAAAHGKALLANASHETATLFAATENREGEWMTQSDGFDKRGLECTTKFDAKAHYLVAEQPVRASDAVLPAQVQQHHQRPHHHTTTSGVSASTFTHL